MFKLAEILNNNNFIFSPSRLVGIRYGLYHQYRCPGVQYHYIWQSFGWRCRNRNPVSQLVWHDKDPSPLIGAVKFVVFQRLCMVTSSYDWKFLVWDSLVTLHDLFITNQNSCYEILDMHIRLIRTVSVNPIGLT